MNRARLLKHDRSLFQQEGEEGDILGYGEDFGGRIGYFAADSIENERQTKAGTCDADYGSSNFCH